MFSIILEEVWYPEERESKQVRSAPRKVNQVSNSRKRSYREEPKEKPDRQSRLETRKSKKAKQDRRKSSRSESRHRSSRHSKPESKKKRRKERRKELSPDYSSSEYDSSSSSDRKRCMVGGAEIEQSNVRCANPVDSHPDWALLQPGELEIERTNFRSYANVSGFFC